MCTGQCYQSLPPMVAIVRRLDARGAGTHEEEVGISLHQVCHVSRISGLCFTRCVKGLRYQTHVSPGWSSVYDMSPMFQAHEFWRQDNNQVILTWDIRQRTTLELRSPSGDGTVLTIAFAAASMITTTTFATTNNTT